MSMLGRAQILARKPKVLEVTLPDSDEKVTIRRMSALDWERIRERDPNDQNLGMQLATCLCDPEGKRLFDPEVPEDVKTCSDQFALVEAGTILAAAGKLAVLPKRDDVLKNSEASPNGDLATV